MKVIPFVHAAGAVMPLTSHKGAQPPDSLSLPTPSQPGVIPCGQAITSVPLFSVASCPSVAPSRYTQEAAQTLLSLPDLEALICFPGPLLAGVALRKPQARTLSSALPPIPGKVIERIRAGSFVDLKELLPDNVALLQHLQGSHAIILAVD